MPDGSGRWLSRTSLRRVLVSLLAWELAAARGQNGRSSMARTDASGWADDAHLSGDGEGQPGCDSLELLRLGAAANEAFHLHEARAEVDLLGRDRIGDWLDAIEGAWSAGVDRITFMTSGSTAAPKRCTHPMSHLATETTFLAQRFGDRRRIVAWTPAHHIYGFLFTAMLADSLGAEVWDASGASASTLHQALRQGDLVVSFPERWDWVERSLPSFPTGVSGVVSTAVCPALLRDGLLSKGLAELVEIYGSSETAGVALRTDPTQPYRLMPHWRFMPPNSAGTSPTIQHESGRRASLPDRVTMAGRDAFVLDGRVDGAVQVGGLNVLPPIIADRLRACPGVGDIAVRLMRPDEGSRLKAFVVPAASANEAELADALRRWSMDHLSTVERPVSFSFGSRLPVSEMGKATDW